MSFAVRSEAQPNTDVPKFVRFARLPCEDAPARILIGRRVGSRREVSEVHADLWRRCRDEGRDFDDGGVAVKMGKGCLLISVFSVKKECGGKIRPTRHGWC